jgi:hypothetical protein
MNRVGARFQIVIDRRVRAELGVKPGDLAVEHVEEGRLVVDFVPARHHDSLYGLLRKPRQPPITDWQELKDRAWSMRTAEIRDALERDSEHHRGDAG